jgi:hypothetical protein
MLANSPRQATRMNKRPERRLKPTLQTKVRATRASGEFSDVARASACSIGFSWINKHATWILPWISVRGSGEWKRQLERYVADYRRFMPRAGDGITS